jgi:hypothetical protein
VTIDLPNVTVAPTKMLKGGGSVARALQSTILETQLDIIEQI